MTETMLGHTEIFWMGTQAIVGALGLVILFEYTRYTRKMMKLAELSRRSSVVPVFYIVGSWRRPVGLDPLGQTAPTAMKLEVKNIGQGPALFLQAWFQPVSADFRLNDTDIFTPDKSVEFISGISSALLKDQEMTLRLSFDQNRVWLLVIGAADLAGGSNQLQWLIGPKTENMSMVHSLNDSQGERLVGIARRFVEIVKATGRELKELEDYDPD